MKRFIFIVMTALLTACGPYIVYDYTPPHSPEGRVCTAQCNNQRTYCQMSNQNAYQQCLNNYNQMMYSYNSCKQAGGQHCYHPPGCISQSNWQCDESYRGCFTSCGGTVTSHVVEDKD